MTLLLLPAVLPVQVSLDRQVGPSQRLHQSLTQLVLLLQDVLQVAAEALQLLDVAGCQTHTHTHTVTLSGPVGGSILTHSLTNSPTNQLTLSLTQVESVCDISAPLLHLQQLHLQLQLQNTKQEVGHSVQSPEGGSVNGCLRGNTTSSSCRCVPILCSAWRSLEEKAGLNPEEARPIST